MKIRLDFVTNSSSSSFILGEPGGTSISVKDVRKYISNLTERISQDTSYYPEFLIDLRYDNEKKYTLNEISFVLEVIGWYIQPEIVMDGVNYDPETDCYWWIDENYEYQESYTTINGLPEIRTESDLTANNIKCILDFAYTHLGEVLIGSSGLEFYPIELYNELLQDKNIKYLCNHMG